VSAERNYFIEIGFLLWLKQTKSADQAWIINFTWSFINFLAIEFAHKLEKVDFLTCFEYLAKKN